MTAISFFLDEASVYLKRLCVFHYSLRALTASSRSCNNLFSIWWQKPCRAFGWSLYQEKRAWRTGPYFMSNCFAYLFLERTLLVLTVKEKAAVDVKLGSKKQRNFFWIADWRECWQISKGYDVCLSQWSVVLRGHSTMNRDHTGYHLAWPHIIAIQYFAESRSKSYFFKTTLIYRHFQSSLRFSENI